MSTLSSPERVLVVVNERVPSHALRDVLRSHIRDAPACEVLLVAPALNSRLRHWLSDEDRAKWEAYHRLRDVLDRLNGEYPVEGIVGDADPIQAVADALAVFPADSVIIATNPHSRTNWLERDLVARVRELTSRPVERIVVDDSPTEAVVTSLAPRALGRGAPAAA
jgi:hypothetical protein